MVTLKAPSLERKDVIEALYLLLGQDFKGGTWPMDRKRFGYAPWRNNRAYMAEDYDDEEPWESGYYEGDWIEEPTYASYEDYDHEPEEPEEFENEAGYYGDEQWPDPDCRACQPSTHG